MKLIYLTAKGYPSSTADHIFVREMARSFTKQSLAGDFELVIANETGEELNAISRRSLNLLIGRGRSVYYFFWLPFYIRKYSLNSNSVVFFSNDPNLLIILILWKKFLRLKYHIISDWHMIFEDKRSEFIAKNSNALIATTEHLKNLISERLSINSDKMLVAYGGVDMSHFRDLKKDKTVIRKNLGLPENDFLVGYVGFYKTMGMSKGLDIMIEALNNIKRIQKQNIITYSKIKMVFVGGRENEIAEYESLAEEKDVREQCIFIPTISSPEIPSYEKAMDVLVIPYPDKQHFRDYGFPMKAYEYMASGVPIIYSNLPIIEEVLGDCAISFKVDDSGDLADKILNIMKGNSRQTNDNFASDQANKAFVKVENCSWDKRAEKILGFAQSPLSS